MGSSLAGAGHTNGTDTDEDEQDDTGWLVYVFILISLTALDRVVVPLLAKCMEDPLALARYRVLSEIVVWVATVPVYYSTKDGLIVGLAAAVMVFITLAEATRRGSLGLLAGFYSNKLDPGLDEVPLAAMRNAVAKHFQADLADCKTSAWPFGHYFCRTKFGPPAASAKVVFEPAGARNFPDAFHIRCPALPGAPGESKAATQLSVG